MAIAYFRHTPVGKATQAEPYTSAAHARYIMRSAATIMVYSERMPRQYHAVQRYLIQHENTLRKNGRVCDKFIIAVPRELSPEAAHVALRRFGNRISEGKAPFLFTLQDWDSGNPHAHFMFIDRDPETGKRVFRTSDRDSTERLKLVWESTVNEMFAEQGIPAEIEFGPSNDNARELERDGGEQLPDEEPAPEPEPLPAPELDAEPNPVPEPEPLPEPTTETPTEDAREGEDEMAPTIEREMETDGALPSMAAHDVRQLYSAVTELAYIEHAITRRNDAREAYERAVADAEEARTRTSLFEVQSLPLRMNHKAAQDRLQGLSREDGRLKGFGVKLFGLELKSPTRRRAEAALGQVKAGEMAAGEADRMLQGYKDQAEQYTNHAAMLRERTETLENNLRLYGTDAEIERAKADYEETIAKRTAELSPERAREAYEDGEVTPDEYRAYLVHHGDERLLAEFDEAMDVERDQSSGRDV